MRQKTKNIRNQGSYDKKNGFFGPVPKSHTQMGPLSAKNASKKFSRLGTFNISRETAKKSFLSIFGVASALSQIDPSILL